VQDSPPAVWTTAGMANTSLAALDNEMANFMALRNIKRGTLAVTRNGKLVFDRAYTWGPTNLAPTQTTNLFRIIALTRQFTSVAIFQLIQAGVISLDQPIGTILDLSTALDPQFATVTIRQLLQDWGGWDSNVSGDPMYRDDFVISANLNQPLPTTPQIIFDYMKYQFLNYAPGTSNVFSNFGYSLLGRIIETVTGMSYEQFVKANVLAPAGIWDMRLGKSLLADADPAEVDYEDPFNRIVASVMGTNSPAMVPIQYGGFNLSSADACFAWLASAADLVRFSSSFDVHTNSPLLPPDLISMMWSQPPELSGSPPTYYGAGWLVRPLGGGAYNAWHDGYADGSFSYTVRRADGFCWAVLFNRFDNSGIVPNYYNIDAEMNNAINSVVSWPAYDLFDANGDGILDAWQVRYFGSATSPAAAPGADPDGDGLNNLNEYINLTDPTNPASVTRLGASQVANSQSVGLDWFAARGRLYTLETSTNLASPAWQPLAAAIDLVGANAQATITDTPITTTFYRLKTRLQRP
jgi:CubicO group peptidase (beta-lactamase class C family)